MLVEALDYLENGQISFEYHVNHILNYTESLDLKEFDIESITEGIDIKAAFKKIKEAIINFVKKVKEWISKIGTFLKNAIQKLRGSLSKKFDKNSERAKEEIDIDDCFDTNINESATLRQDRESTRDTKYLTEIISPGFPLVRFERCLNINAISDIKNFAEIEENEIYSIISDYLGLKSTSEDYHEMIKEWKLQVLMSAKSKLQRKVSIGSLAGLILGNLNANLDTLYKIKKLADTFTDIKDDAESELKDANQEDYIKLRKIINNATKLFTVINETSITISNAIGMGQSTRNAINIFLNAK